MSLLLLHLTLLNLLIPINGQRSRDWENRRRSVDFIEEQTGLNLLNNIPLEILNELERNVDTGPTAITTLPSVPEGDDDEDELTAS